LDNLPSVVDLADPGFLFLRLLPRDDLLGLAKRIREGRIDEDVEMPLALDPACPFPFRLPLFIGRTILFRFIILPRFFRDILW